MKFLRLISAPVAHIGQKPASWAVGRDSIWD